MLADLSVLLGLPNKSNSEDMIKSIADEVLREPYLKPISSIDYA
jgi:hypothetical protein